jgi:CarD family transcriptional regulator
MQFNVGDLIVHPAHGVGQIVEIEEKQFSEKGESLYYKVVSAKRTVWIPVEAHEAELRRVTAKSELDRYRKLLKSPPVPLDKNHHRRHLDLVKRLKLGSFQVLCEIVRDLTAWGRRKPLGPSDTTILKRSWENLYEEWATAAGVSTAEATKEVEALLRVARPASLG